MTRRNWETLKEDMVYVSNYLIFLLVIAIIRYTMDQRAANANVDHRRPDCLNGPLAPSDKITAFARERR